MEQHKTNLECLKRYYISTGVSQKGDIGNDFLTVKKNVISHIGQAPYAPDLAKRELCSSNRFPSRVNLILHFTTGIKKLIRPATHAFLADADSGERRTFPKVAENTER
jgi:hypothetical protein